MIPKCTIVIPLLITNKLLSGILYYNMSYIPCQSIIDSVVKWLTCIGPSSNPGLGNWHAAHPVVPFFFWGGQNMGTWRNLGKVNCDNLNVTAALSPRVESSYPSQAQGQKRYYEQQGHTQPWHIDEA